MSEQDFEQSLTETEAAKQAAEVARLQAERSTRLAAQAALDQAEPISPEIEPKIEPEIKPPLDIPSEDKRIEPPITEGGTAPRVFDDTEELRETGSLPDREALQQSRLQSIEDASDNIDASLSSSGFEDSDAFNSAISSLNDTGSVLKDTSTNISSRIQVLNSDIISFEDSIDQLNKDLVAKDVTNIGFINRKNALEQEQSRLNDVRIGLIQEQGDLTKELDSFNLEQRRLNSLISELTPLISIIENESRTFNIESGRSAELRQSINDVIRAQNQAINTQKSQIRDIINSLDAFQQSLIETGSGEAALGETAVVAASQRVKEELIQTGNELERESGLSQVTAPEKIEPRDLTFDELDQIIQRELGVGTDTALVLGISKPTRSLSGIEIGRQISADVIDIDAELGQRQESAKRGVLLATAPEIRKIDIIVLQARGDLELGEAFDGVVGEKEVAIIRNSAGTPPTIIAVENLVNIGSDDEPRFLAQVLPSQTAELTNEQRKVQQEKNTGKLIAPLIFVVEKSQVVSEVLAGTAVGTVAVASSVVPGLRDIDSLEQFRSELSQRADINNPLGIFRDVREAYQETDLPFGVKGALEFALDPLILIPVVGVTGKLGIAGTRLAVRTAIASTRTFTAAQTRNFVRSHITDIVSPTLRLGSKTRKAAIDQLVNIRAQIAATKLRLVEEGFAPVLTGSLRAGGQHPLIEAERKLVSKLNSSVFNLSRLPESKFVISTVNRIKADIADSANEVKAVLLRTGADARDIAKILVGDPDQIAKLSASVKSEISTIVRKLDDKLTIPVTRKGPLDIDGRKLVEGQKIVGAVKFTNNPNQFIVESAKLASDRLLRPTLDATISAIKAAPTKSVNLSKAVGKAIASVRPQIVDDFAKIVKETGSVIKSTVSIDPRFAQRVKLGVQPQRLDNLKPDTLVSIASNNAFESNLQKSAIEALATKVKNGALNIDDLAGFTQVQNAIRASLISQRGASPIGLRLSSGRTIGERFKRGLRPALTTPISEIVRPSVELITSTGRGITRLGRTSGRGITRLGDRGERLVRDTTSRIRGGFASARRNVEINDFVNNRTNLVRRLETALNERTLRGFTSKGGRGPFRGGPTPSIEDATLRSQRILADRIDEEIFNIISQLRNFDRTTVSRFGKIIADDIALKSRFGSTAKTISRERAKDIMSRDVSFVANVKREGFRGNITATGFEALDENIILSQLRLGTKTTTRTPVRIPGRPVVPLRPGEFLPAIIPTRQTGLVRIGRAVKKKFIPLKDKDRLIKPKSSKRSPRFRVLKRKSRKIDPEDIRPRRKIAPLSSKPLTRLLAQEVIAPSDAELKITTTSPLVSSRDVSKVISDKDTIGSRVRAASVKFDKEVVTPRETLTKVAIAPSTRVGLEQQFGEVSVPKLGSQKSVSVLGQELVDDAILPIGSIELGTGISTQDELSIAPETLTDPTTIISPTTITETPIVDPIDEFISIIDKPVKPIIKPKFPSKPKSKKAPLAIISTFEERRLSTKRRSLESGLRLVRRSRFGESTWTLFDSRASSVRPIQTFGPLNNSRILESNLLTKKGKSFLRRNFRQDDKASRGVDLALSLLAVGEIQISEIQNILPWEIRMPQGLINV